MKKSDILLTAKKTMPYAIHSDKVPKGFFCDGKKKLPPSENHSYIVQKVFFFDSKKNPCIRNTLRHSS